MNAQARRGRARQSLGSLARGSSRRAKQPIAGALLGLVAGSRSLKELEQLTEEPRPW
jgi:hypothetical protein